MAVLIDRTSNVMKDGACATGTQKLLLDVFAQYLL